MPHASTFTRTCQGRLRDSALDQFPVSMWCSPALLALWSHSWLLFLTNAPAVRAVGVRVVRLDQKRSRSRTGLGKAAALLRQIVPDAARDHPVLHTGPANFRIRTGVRVRPPIGNPVSRVMVGHGDDRPLGQR